MKEDLVEVLVACKTKGGLMVLRIVLYILCGVAALLGLTGVGLIPIIVAVILGILGYLAGSRASIEYEYAYFDKEIVIDAIYSQQKRKHMFTIETGKIEAIVRVNGSKMKEYERRQFVTRDYSTGKKENAEEVYAFIYEGSLKILMEPGERLLNTLGYVCPRKIYKN
ncbi:MAG: DUF6106 family protein [Lachnospiraceae bacterium]|nr:DUF6106 family protein [Lachnospiraceae bacterium]